ncbi:hypothetical protein DSECCO2_648130 [anaerobic digester metagenome]
MRPHERGGQEHRLAVAQKRLVHGPLDGLDDALGQARLHGQVGSVIGLAHAFLDRPFDLGREVQNGQRAVGREVGLDDGAAHAGTHVFGQLVGILHRGPVIGHGFGHGQQVADGHAFLDEVLQDLLHAAERHRAGHKVFHGLGRALGQVVEQGLHFLAAQELVQVALEDFRQVRGDDRRRIDHGVAGEHGLVLLQFRHPQRGQVEGGLARLHALDAVLGVARVHGQEMVDEDFRRSHLVALDEHHVLARAQLEVVAQVQGGDDHAHVQGELAADGADAREQVAVLFLVHERDEAVAHLEFQGVQRQQGLDLFRRFQLRRGLFVLGLAFGREQFLLSGRQAADHEQQGGHDQEGQGRQARHQAEQEQHARHQAQRPGMEGQLGQEFLAHLGFGRGPGHDHARGRGDDDRRNDGDQAVADGQQGVGLGGVLPVHALLHDPDQEAAEDVDGGDDDGGGDVAGNELARAVHGAVEVGFLADGLAAFRGLLLVDEPGVQVRFDGHLLARHGVEGEACGHFGDAGGAGHDDFFVDGEEHEEDDAADDVVAADDELAEGLDHVAGGRGAFVAVQQDQAGRCHVHGQAQHGGDEQQGRVDGEFQRRTHEHAGNEHHEADGNGEGEHQVDERRRDGHEHHEQDDDHAGGQHDIALLGELLVVEFDRIRLLRHDFDALSRGPPDQRGRPGRLNLSSWARIEATAW